MWSVQERCWSIYIPRYLVQVVCFISESLIFTLKLQDWLELLLIKRGAAWFNSFKSLKNDKCQSYQFPYILNPVIKNSTILTRGEQPKNIKKTAKECFDIQAGVPKNREVPGICPVCPMVNPALTVRYDQLRKTSFHHFKQREQCYFKRCSGSSVALFLLIGNPQRLTKDT